MSRKRDPQRLRDEAPVIRHFLAGVRIYNEGPAARPVTIANQTRGNDQGAAEHFVSRFARTAAPLPHPAA